MFWNCNTNIAERKIEKKIRKKERKKEKKTEKYLLWLISRSPINADDKNFVNFITVASMPSELRGIGNYAVSNLTLQHHYKNAAT